MKTAAKPTDILSEVASTAHDTVDRASEGANSFAHHTVNKAVNAAKPAAKWLKERRSDFEQLPVRGGKYISANPMKSVGLAVVAGIILARIIL